MKKVLMAAGGLVALGAAGLLLWDRGAPSGVESPAPNAGGGRPPEMSIVGRQDAPLVVLSEFDQWIEDLRDPVKRFAAEAALRRKDAITALSIEQLVRMACLDDDGWAYGEGPHWARSMLADREDAADAIPTLVHCLREGWGGAFEVLEDLAHDFGVQEIKPHQALLLDTFHADPDLRRALVPYVARLEAAAIPLLNDLLVHLDAWTVEQERARGHAIGKDFDVADCLAAMGDEVLPALKKAVVDRMPDPTLRTSVETLLYALDQLGDPGVATLISFAESDDEALAKLAADELYSRGYSPHPSLATLEPALTSRHTRTRRAAVNRLPKEGEGAWRAMHRALTDRDPDVRRGALRKLRGWDSLPAAARDHLLGLLADPAAENRVWAGWVLVRHASGDDLLGLVCNAMAFDEKEQAGLAAIVRSLLPTSRESFLRIATSSQGLVRRGQLLAVALLDDEHLDEGFRQFAQASVKAKDPSSRLYAAAILASPTRTDGVDTLGAALASSAKIDRRVAATGLRRSKALAVGHLPALIARLGGLPYGSSTADSETQAFYAAVYTIGRHAPEQMIPHVTWTDRPYVLHQVALYCLRRSGLAGLEVLEQAWPTITAEQRSFLSDWVVETEDDASQGVRRRLLALAGADPSPHVRWSFAWDLVHESDCLDAERALPILLDLLGEAPEWARNAAELLPDLIVPLKVLQEALAPHKTHPDPVTRARIEVALSEAERRKR